MDGVTFSVLEKAALIISLITLQAVGVILLLIAALKLERYFTGRRLAKQKMKREIDLAESQLALIRGMITFRRNLFVNPYSTERKTTGTKSWTVH